MILDRMFNFGLNGLNRYNMDKEAGIKKIAEDFDSIQSYFEKIKDINSYDEFPSFRENPFLCLLGDEMKITWKTKGVLNGVASLEYMDKDTGQMVSAQENRIFRRKEYVDGGTFTKIYMSQVKDVFSLSYAGLKVFGYVVTELDKSGSDNGMITFRQKECMEFCDWKSRSRIYAGLIELISRGIICKTDVTWQFFVNPLYVFKGNRLVIFNEYIRQDFFETVKGIGE